MFVITLLILLYLPTLVQPIKFADDVSNLADSSPLLRAPNPFVYWQSGSGFTKAWPLTYSILWGFRNFTDGDDFYLRFTELLLHICNGALICSVLRHLRSRNAALFAVIFLLHPLHVETISTMIQISTVLATLGGLIFLRWFFLVSDSPPAASGDGNIRRNGLWAHLALAVSLTAKPLLSGFGFLVLKARSHHHRFLNLAIKATLIGFAVFFGYKTWTGLFGNWAEQPYGEHFFPQAYSLTELSPDQRSDFYVQQLATSPSAIALSRTDFASENLVRYIQKIFYPQDLMLFYPYEVNAFLSLIGVSIFLIMGLGALFFLLRPLSGRATGPKILSNRTMLGLFCFLFLAGFIPVSGLFYVPFMKLTPRYDHHAYFLVAIVVLFLGLLSSKIKENRWIPALLLAICGLLATYTYRHVRLYNSQVEFLQKNISLNPGSLALKKMLACAYFEHGDKSKALELVRSLQVQHPTDIDLMMLTGRFSD